MGCRASAARVGLDPEAVWRRYTAAGPEEEGREREAVAAVVAGLGLEARPAGPGTPAYVLGLVAANLSARGAAPELGAYLREALGGRGGEDPRRLQALSYAARGPGWAEGGRAQFEAAWAAAAWAVAGGGAAEVFEASAALGPGFARPGPAAAWCVAAAWAPQWAWDRALSEVNRAVREGRPEGPGAWVMYMGAMVDLGRNCFGLDARDPVSATWDWLRAAAGGGAPRGAADAVLGALGLGFDSPAVSHSLMYGSLERVRWVWGQLVRALRAQWEAGRLDPPAGGVLREWERRLGGPPADAR